MNTSLCADVQAWLDGLDRAAANLSPAHPFNTHVISCAHCQQALRIASAPWLPPTIALVSISCEACQRDLAAFIDAERDLGPQTALTMYPLVWWHLWTCFDCAESYQMVLALQAAEAAGELPPLPLYSLLLPVPVPVSVPRRSTPVPQIRSFQLHRAVLLSALAPQLGVAMGGAEDDEVIDEREDAGYDLRTSLRRVDGRWMVVITLEPPLVGDAIVTLGTYELRAPLNMQGEALLGPIPDELLTSLDGPDLAIRIESAY